MYHKRLQKPSYKGGVCVAHEVATTRCTTKDCTNQAIKGEVCVARGVATPRCTTKDCTNQAIRGGLCCSWSGAHVMNNAAYVMYWG